MYSTRKEYDEMVSRPGKFRGEKPWTPYFYDLWLTGNGTEIDNEESTTFQIIDEDLKMFPELTGKTQIVLNWDDNGFVTSTIS